MTARRHHLSIGAGAALLVVGVIGWLGATQWVGKPFAGFLFLENRVVASAGLAHWPATAGGQIYQHQVIALDGVRMESAEEIHARVRSLPAGTPITYTFHGGERAFEREITTRVFGWRDFLLLFGTYLVNGIVLGGTALLLCGLAGGRAAARASLPFLLLGAFWGLSAMDLYGPYRLFRLHALCESMLFPAVLHLALVFPRPARLAGRAPWIPAAGYAFAGGLALVYQAGLEDPSTYVTAHLLATSALGAALVVLLASIGAHYLHQRATPLRVEMRGLLAGALLALVLPICLTLAETFTGGRMPQNAVGFTAFLFPLSIAYTVRRLPAPEGPQ